MRGIDIFYEQKDFGSLCGRGVRRRFRHFRWVWQRCRDFRDDDVFGRIVIEW